MEEKNPKTQSGRATNLKLAAAFIAGIVAAGFLPLYEHSNFVERNGASHPVRTHRVTGKTEMYYGEWIETDEGWLKELFTWLTPAPTATSIPTPTPERVLDKNLSKAELAKLDGTLGLTDIGYINADIYNGTDRAIASIVINLSVTKTGVAPIARRYELRPAYPSLEAAPLRSTTFRADAGIRFSKGQNIQWTIESATAR